MAKGQYLSGHQQKIVKRYYEHKDALLAQRLAEIVSDLALADDEKKRERLWKRAEKAMLSAGVEKGRVEKVMASGKIEALAKLVGELA